MSEMGRPRSLEYGATSRYSSYMKLATVVELAYSVMCMSQGFLSMFHLYED